MMPSSTDAVSVLMPCLLYTSYIERGAQSLPVLEFVAQLYARNPQNVRLLLGNWDMGILSAIEKGDCALLYKNMQRFKAYAGNTLYNEMCARVGMDSGSESAMRAAHSKVMEKFGALIRFFLERPIVLDAGEMVFVHGGLPHGGLQALDPGHPYGCMKFDDFLWQDSVFARPVVFGHMPVVNGRRHVPCALPYFDARRNVIGIDGGCGVKHEGQLNACLLYTSESGAVSGFCFAHRHAMPVRAAAGPQNAEICVKL